MKISILQHIGPKQSRKVEPRDMPHVRELLPAMAGICQLPHGVFIHGAIALAHCQVDQEDPLRFFVHVEGYAVVNPVIHECRGTRLRLNEGCMSWSEHRDIGVWRYRKIVATFTVLRMDGTTEEFVRTEVSGQLAQVFQHEVDHFNGKHIFPPSA